MRCTLALLVCFAPLAHATLGADAGSVTSDAAKLEGQAQRIAPGVYEITAPNRLTVRQYANSDGRIFALTWAGETMPDLSVLLGEYYRIFQAQREHAGPARNLLRLQTPELQLESAGRLRAFRGRAIAPALTPPGFKPEDLR